VNSNDDGEGADAESRDSAAKPPASEPADEKGDPDAPCLEAKSSEFSKAVFYWALSRH